LGVFAPLSSTSHYAANTNQLLTKYSFTSHSLALSLALFSSETREIYMAEVLLDLNLPNEDGWEIFEWLTSDHPLVPADRGKDKIYQMAWELWRRLREASEDNQVARVKDQAS
jgi:hypothetical protein